MHVHQCHALASQIAGPGSWPPASKNDFLLVDPNVSCLISPSEIHLQTGPTFCSYLQH